LLPISVVSRSRQDLEREYSREWEEMGVQTEEARTRKRTVLSLITFLPGFFYFHLVSRATGWTQRAAGVQLGDQQGHRQGGQTTLAAAWASPLLEEAAR